MDWTPLWLTFRLALLTTGLLWVVGTPLALLLAYRRFWGRSGLEALITLPLVLPPTVLGFYLLVAFGPQQGVGAWLQEHLGLQLLFSFEGLVVASMLYSLPFMVQPLQAGFQQVPKPLREAAYVLGKSRWTTFWRVVLPQARPALLSALVLTFAHTVGEFGVVLMIGGNLPGETRVASIAIYEEVEALQYGAAHQYSAILIGLAFVALWLLYRTRGSLLTRHAT